MVTLTACVAHRQPNRVEQQEFTVLQDRVRLSVPIKKRRFLFSITTTLAKTE